MASLALGLAGSALFNAAGPAMWTLAGSLGTTASTLGFFAGSTIGGNLGPLVVDTHAALTASSGRGDAHSVAA